MRYSLMQQQAANSGVSSGLQQNGDTADSGGSQIANGNLLPETDNDVSGVNGEANPSSGPPKIMDKTNQDIVRLIGQHLKTVGLEYVTLFIILPYFDTLTKQSCLAVKGNLLFP